LWCREVGKQAQDERREGRGDSLKKKKRRIRCGRHTKAEEKAAAATEKRELLFLLVLFYRIRSLQDVCRLVTPVGLYVPKKEGARKEREGRRRVCACGGWPRRGREDGRGREGVCKMKTEEDVKW
jgi:hypothetical protein